MLTVFFVYNRDKVVFKNITFLNRSKGSGSINIRKIIEIGMKSVRDFIVFRSYMRKQSGGGKNQ
jgi:hypothetical protein